MKKLFLSTLAAIILLVSCEPIERITMQKTIAFQQGSAQGRIIDLSSASHSDYGFVYDTLNSGMTGQHKFSMGQPSRGDFTGALNIPYGNWLLRTYVKENSGTLYGNDLSVYVAYPVIQSAQTSNLTYNSAAIATVIYANNNIVTVSIEYGSTTVYGNQLNVSAPLIDNIASAINVQLTGLTRLTTYHCRIKIQSDGGIVYGNDISFITPDYPKPIFLSQQASNISNTSASLSAVIIPNNGKISVSFQYGTTTSYGSTIISSSDTINGSNSITVNSSLTGLTPSTIYHCRVKTVGVAGIINSDDFSFTTTATPVPFVVSISTVNVDVSGAMLKGIANANNLQSQVTFEYGTTTDYGQTVTPVPNVIAGATPTSVIATISGLNNYTTYHYRLKITNNIYNPVYSADSTFFTQPSPYVVDVDGNKYTNVLIGTQTWMVENLKVRHYREGNPITIISNNSDWHLPFAGAGWYNNDSATYNNSYGLLYNGYIANLNVSVCPIGWHVPNDVDWSTLSNYLGGDSIAGGKLKESGTAHWLVPNTGATNQSGFTALAGGMRNGLGNFEQIGTGAYYWSTAPNYPYDFSKTNVNSVMYNNDSIYRDPNVYIQPGYSIRCIKDSKK